jgi:hypothetical protein
MAQVPKPSDIPNVFAMNDPQHMLTKLYWEVHQLMDAMSAWTKATSFPEPIFYASNAAITAWHISDWLWQSRPETREKLKAKFKFECDDKIPKGLHDGLRLFQDAVATDSRTLEICRSIANGSKHMRTMKTDDSSTHCGRIVLGDALALGVHGPKTDLSIGVALLS